MQALLIFTLIVFIWGKVGGVINKAKTDTSIKTTVVEVTPSNTPLPSPTPLSKKEVKGANISIHVSTLTSGSSPTTNASGEINDYIYPTSKVINSSNSHLTLETSDNSNVVVNWYTSKMSAKKMNNQNLQVNNNNNLINDVLKASNTNSNVEVDINGHEGSTLTITITIS